MTIRSCLLACYAIGITVGCGSSESEPAGGTAATTTTTATATGGGGSTGAGGGTAGAGQGGLADGRYLDEIFADVDVQKDLAYGQAGGDALLLDLYQPAGDTDPARAAIVWIHGGGFIGGNKVDPHLVELSTRFAKRGYVTVSIEYRLLGANVTGIQAAEADARAAVRWLRKNAATYRIDEARIAIGGSSAGAITSLFVAYDELEGDSGNPGLSSDVSAVVDLWGALYDETVMEAGEAPVIIIHGTADTTVPYSETTELVARAEAVGVTYELHPLPGKAHAPWGEIDQYIAWSAPFLYQHVIVP